MYIRILSVWDFNLFCNYQQITQCASRQTIAMLLRQTIAILLRKHSQPAPCGHRLRWLTKTLAAL